MQTSWSGGPGANSVSGGAGNDVLDGVNGVAMSGGSGNDLYIVESTSDTVSESSGGGTDTVVSYVSTTLGANVENLILRGSALSGTGNTLANSISGNGSANTLAGGAGNDTLTGGAGSDSLAGGADADTFVFNSTSGFDTITDWSSAADTLRFSMAAIKVGDGDTLVENAVVRSAPGGFSTAAELVVFSANIAGAITTASAAAAIGSATSAYAVGAERAVRGRQRHAERRVPVPFGRRRRTGQRRRADRDRAGQRRRHRARRLRVRAMKDSPLSFPRRRESRARPGSRPAPG